MNEHTQDVCAGEGPGTKSGLQELEHCEADVGVDPGANETNTCTAERVDAQRRASSPPVRHVACRYIARISPIQISIRFL